MDETKLPKRVTLRMSIRDYKKIVQISAIADEMKKDKDFRKVTKDIIGTTYTNPDVPISVDALIGMLSRLPTMEVNISRPSAKRSTPKTMYFTDPQPVTKAVKTLYKAVKGNLGDKPLRYNQTKQTCPSDVRTMFYTYVHANGLVVEETREITIDKLLHNLAPKILDGVTSIKRKDSSKIWHICSEIRGI